VPSGLAGVTAISAGEHHAPALRRDGTVVAWGDDAFGQSSLPAGRIRATAISAGGGFSLALLTDGTVAAWGDNSYGQLDVPEGLANVTAISAGVFHALALRADGDVIGWGGGRRRGESDHPWRLVDFKAVAAGEGFSLTIRAA
jgi:alpha-tubulin suppressor-like RCC1 family protein